MMRRAEAGSDAVEEMQGLYGPFTFPEKLLQQIWWRGDFDRSRAITADGDQVRIVHPGRWNHLGGPDFKDVRLQIGGTELVGDVELHLRAADWAAHGHAADPAYANVVLHVILFPDEKTVTTGAAGRNIPVLALLPLLNHDLEEYAADEAIERLADHPLAHAQRELTAMSPEKLLAALQENAGMRWRQKVHYARLRVDRLGWEAACHHTALEILGYRFNRAAMLAVASARPLADWARSGDEIVEPALARFADHWKTQGVRPANHPRTRLRQYARWMETCPNWPGRLLELAGELPRIELSAAVQTARARREHRVSAAGSLMDTTIFHGTIGGTRCHTMICDGLLPLLAAHSGTDAVAGLWYVWPAGDIPARYARLLRELGAVDRRYRPLSHGVVQGLIGWLLVADKRRDAAGPS